jgi:septum formation inhibitor MinC
MPEYSDAESVSSSESESESDCENIESVLKKVPKAAAPVVKAKRVYVRKQPLDDKSKNVIVDKLAKAREAKALKATAKKQEEAQEKAEMAELKKLKSEGKLKIKKDKPAEISIPKKKREKNVIVKEIHHYHDAKPVATEPKPKPPAPPKPPKPPAPPRMVFA